MASCVLKNVYSLQVYFVVSIIISSLIMVWSDKIQGIISKFLCMLKLLVSSDVGDFGEGPMYC